MKKTITILILIIISLNTGFSQTTSLENDEWSLSIRPNGTFESIVFKQSNSKIHFFKENFSGPSWYLQIGNKVIEPPAIPNGQNKFKYLLDRLILSTEYKDENGRLLILATIKNIDNVPFQPTKLGLRLGINTYMNKYPDWESKLFPTLLRCEKTHFWSYFMSPVGKILVVASPDAIASWSHDYSVVGARPPYEMGGHRITSVNLDFMNTLPLPERHPKNLWEIKPGESKTFRVYMDEIENLNKLSEKVSELTQAPFINMDATSCEKGGEINFSVYSDEATTVEIFSPDGNSSIIKPTSQSNKQDLFSFNETKTEGIYHIKVLSVNGKISEAVFFVRKPYSWYMQNAMKAVVDYPQKASKSHCESWYGFYTTYAGSKYFPNNESLKEADDQFKKIVLLVFDTEKWQPLANKHRVQNISSMIGILVDRYQLFNDKNDLKHALGLSDFLLKTQSSDGAYRAGKVHYTSVIYPAKSLMELLEVLEPLKKDKLFRQHYEKIYASVKMAMDELERNRTDIETEGEMTFEDGMIACSALQLGQFALLQTSKKEKKRYKDAALSMLEQHRCLEQLAIPDARMRSATLRFWEAQYDVVIKNNFFNSPHGWSSWSTYANYYTYLLTGNTKFLNRTFNGLNAAMQMIDLSDGKLRWAFAVNPYLQITQINRNIGGATPLDFPGMQYHVKKYSNRQYTIGEQYVDMVSDWFFANANDNDVHEHFKCLEEVALHNAFLAENDYSNLLIYNCSAEEKDGKIIIIPSEKIITKVHVNLKNKKTVEVKFKDKTVSKIVEPGMTWLSIDD